jgi:hypothetical protein
MRTIFDGTLKNRLILSKRSASKDAGLPPRNPLV